MPDRNITVYDFVRDVPGDVNDTFYQAWSATVTSITGLPNMDKGVRGMEYRITYLPNIDSIMEIYIIKGTNENWQAELLNIDTRRITPDSAAHALVSRTQLLPRTNWIDILRRLNGFEVWDFPNADELSFYRRDIMDGGDYIQIEFADDHRYKCIYYPFIKANQRISYLVKAKKVIEILKSDLKTEKK